MSLAVPLSDPAVPLSETHVYVGCLRSADFANHAERKKTAQTYGGWRLATVPREGCGIAHSSQNLTTIRSWHALTRLDETAQRS
jgi:hypothetical protein